MVTDINTKCCHALGPHISSVCLDNVNPAGCQDSSVISLTLKCPENNNSGSCGWIYNLPSDWDSMSRQFLDY